MGQAAGSNENNDAEAGVSWTPVVCTICKFLALVPEIQWLYVNEEPGSVSVFAAVPEKNFAVERAVYNKQLEIIDEIIATCPGIKLSLRVLSLRGRKISDVITAKNGPVFQRT